LCNGKPDYRQQQPVAFGYRESDADADADTDATLGPRVAAAKV